MAPLISPLNAPTGPSVALSIKLNPDLLRRLRECALNNKSPKLVVKDGHYTIRIEQDDIPCIKIPEHLNVDIYSLDDSAFNGRVTTKLSPITDEKKIAEYKRDLERRNNVTQKPLATPSHSPKKSKVNHYAYTPNNAASTTAKFLHFVALGPIPIPEVGRLLSIPQDHLQKLASEYTQAWQASSYNKADRYPRVERKKHNRALGIPSDDEEADPDILLDSDNEDDTDLIQSGAHVLKDKAYKELKPLEWAPYSKFERKLVIANANRALTRLGYSETHPLRKMINEHNKQTIAKQTIALDEEKPHSGLGGGILISKKTVPFKKSHTDSPKLSTSKELTLEKKSSSAINSPRAGKRKFSSSSGGSNGSSSSSEDEKSVKKLKGESTSPSSEEDKSVHENKVSKRIEYYTNLASKFKVKYKEYESLYRRLKSKDEKDTDKKTLIKLFELHNSLSQWKKSLWDYEKEIRQRQSIMGLSKHKKTQPVKQVKLKVLDY